MIEAIREFFLAMGDVGLVLWTLVTFLCFTLRVVIGVASYTLAARKVIGWMHARHGPIYVGQLVPGLAVIQAFADVFKMLFKELVTPNSASRFLYRLAPL